MGNFMSGSNVGFSDTKKHYLILDGLRGIAALIVVCFHILEVYSGYDHRRQIINHGYLAVDFFFLLSGFVIGYAYDDRWKGMTAREFFKRRLIRLHPMIVMGMLVGGLCFYFSASPSAFPDVGEYPVWKLAGLVLYGFTLLPVLPGMDVRGWGEMHPLNGPAWSLFYEYVANILYGLWIRRFSNVILFIIVFFSGCALAELALTQGDVVGGWALDGIQTRVGITRLLFPFFTGLLLSRICKPGVLKFGFSICSVLLVSILSFPRIGGEGCDWMNGLYDACSIIFIFPLIVYWGASSEIRGKWMKRICRFLGDISYPLYITHYPLIYIYTAWVSDRNMTISEGWPAGLMVLTGSVLLAYACLRFYDLPVRKWLSERFLKKRG